MANLKGGTTIGGVLGMTVANFSNYALPLTGGIVTGNSWFSFGSSEMSSYTWVNAAITTNSIEIVNSNVTSSGKSPTLQFHSNGYGGPRFRQGTSDNILWLESGQASSARSNTAGGSTYFTSLKLTSSDANGIYINEQAVIHSGTIGSQSVNYAASSGSASILTGIALTAGYSVSGAGINYSGPGGPQIMGNTGNAAMLSFHRAGAYAINFGLDTDNQLKVGGWSMGDVRHTILHAGNFSSFAATSGHTHDYATHRGEGTNYVEYSRNVYNNGAYSGSGWIEPSDLGVRYAHHSRGSYGDFYIDVNFGNTLVGKYAADRYQGVFAMGDSYKLPADGASTGNMYGLAWTHTNVGGQSKGGLSHQLLVMDAGITKTAIGTGIWTSGNITAGGDVIAYSSSDKRLKDNIKPIENPIGKILKIGGYTFDWNNNQDTHTGHDIGVIADEIEAVLPEIVVTRENGYKAVKYDRIVALLIEVVKDQQAQIDELKKLIQK